MEADGKTMTGNGLPYMGTIQVATRIRRESIGGSGAPRSVGGNVGCVWAATFPRELEADHHAQKHVLKTGWTIYTWVDHGRPR